LLGPVNPVLPPVVNRLMTTADSIESAQEGDVAAFERLYRENESRIYALCLRMVADRSRAEELTQASFVRAWEKLGSFRGDSAFATWLHRLAVNVVLGDMRSRGRWQARFTEMEDLSAFEDKTGRSSPRAAVDLERAIATLPPKARAIFVLYDIEGYRHAEIAEMTGLAEGTSKAHLHRARKLLREVLRS